MAEYTVTRSATIQAPADRLHSLVDDLRAWQQWSPWEGVDPDLSRTYTGPERGVGARYEWSGNRKAGAGSMEIEESTPERVAIDLSFTAPFKARNPTSFTFVEHEGATTVTWSMRGEHRGFTGLIARAMRIETMVGKDFERGLASLRTVAEG